MINPDSSSFKYLFFFISIIIVISIYFSYETEVEDVNIDAKLKKVATLSYLEQNILESIEKNQTTDLEMYINLSEYLKIELSSRTLEKIEEYYSFFNKSWRNTKEFSTSFVTGEYNSTIGLVGSTTSDMLIVGDIRDISIEGQKFVSGESYDKVVLGLATMGIALTVSQALTIGTSTPLKIGNSILKFARKTGKVSKAFMSVLSSKLVKSIDFTKLKGIDFSSISKVKSGVMSFSKTIDFSHTKKLFKQINSLKNNTSAIDTVGLLKYVDNQKDLNKIVTLSSKYGKNTKGILKILGKNVLKAGKVVVKYTSLLIFQLISLVISLLLFIVSIFSNISFLRKLIR